MIFTKFRRRRTSLFFPFVRARIFFLNPFTPFRFAVSEIKRLASGVGHPTPANIVRMGGELTRQSRAHKLSCRKKVVIGNGSRRRGDGQNNKLKNDIFSFDIDVTKLAAKTFNEL